MRTRNLLTAFLFLSIINVFAQETLNINTANSELKWSGDYTFYFGGHYGTIDFKKGYFIKTNNVITGGEFIIDMNSIKCLDIENEEAKTGLEEHLKNEDFFDVKNHSTAKLVITKVEYHDNIKMKIHANLTIKGVTKPVTFQAEVDYSKKQMTTKFKIDRMLWGINYNSDIRNSAISDAIGFEVKLSL